MNCAEVLLRAAGPDDFDGARICRAQTKDQLRSLTGNEPRAPGQWLSHRAFGSMDDDRGTDCFMLSAGCGEAHLDEFTAQIVAVQVVPFALDLVHEEVQVSVIVQVGANHAAPIAGRVATGQVRDVGEGAISPVEKQLVALIAAEAAPFCKNLTVVPVQESLVADRLQFEFTFARGVTYSRRHHVAPVGASCVEREVAGHKSVGAEDVEATV